MTEPVVLINAFEVPADQAEQFVAAWEQILPPCPDMGNVCFPADDAVRPRYCAPYPPSTGSVAPVT